jgi:DNA-binding transcriptional regulator GbsR (MarR family)
LKRKRSPYTSAPLPQAAAEASPETGAAPSEEAVSSFVGSRNEVATIFGEIAEFWGFTRTQGRVFGFVFMSPRPVSQGEIRDGLEISAGNASMTINSLIDWGAIHREERSYVAETNFFSLITRVLKERERGQLDESLSRIIALREVLGTADDSDPDLDFLLRRSKHLHDFFSAGRAILDAFLARTPLHRMLDRLARRAGRLRPGGAAKDTKRIDA